MARQLGSLAIWNRNGLGSADAVKPNCTISRHRVPRYDHFQMTRGMVHLDDQRRFGGTEVTGNAQVGVSVLDAGYRYRGARRDFGHDGVRRSVTGPTSVPRMVAGTARQTEALARRDAVIQHWDGWGFAGMENDSYLVSDPDDSITGLEAANRWVRDHDLTCDVVAAQRMRRGFYILTTYNCGF